METELDYRTLIPERWRDFEALFGARGACGGCWCMWWRLSRKEFERRKGEANRRAMQAIVHSGQVPGILGYRQGKPVAWCSLGPREWFPVLDRSRVLGRVDHQPVWSVVCFFVERRMRRQGVSAGLLGAAIEHARLAGAPCLEAYPLDPRKAAVAPAFAWTGFARTFHAAGFVEIARRAPTRPILRLSLSQRPAGGSG
jgi:GNAT superfamily N-acetyltransferase